MSCCRFWHANIIRCQCSQLADILVCRQASQTSQPGRIRKCFGVAHATQNPLDDMNCQSGVVGRTLVSQFSDSGSIIQLITRKWLAASLRTTYAAPPVRTRMLNLGDFIHCNSHYTSTFKTHLGSLHQRVAGFAGYVCNDQRLI